MAFDSTVNREVGLRLRRLREQKELTRERLAEYADISVQFLADIETGRKGMTVQTLRKLVNALHCSADDIVFGPAQPADAGAALPPAAGLRQLSGDNAGGLILTDWEAIA